MYRGKKNQPSNRTRILECIFRNAPVARSEIAEMTEITPAAVTTIVAGLIGEHIVIESEEPLRMNLLPDDAKFLLIFFRLPFTASEQNLPRKLL